ncbi:MAG: helix-turn-helix domain-containing protein [Bacillota bacterium]
MATTLGEKIRLARKEAGMTQKDLAGQEYSAAFISQIERGVIRPSLQSLQTLAGRLRKPVGFFMESEADLREKECDWLLVSGRLLSGAGKAPKAGKTLQKAAQMAAEIGDRRREAEAAAAQAALAESQGNLDEADKLYRKALAGFEEVGASEGAILCLLGLGAVSERRNQGPQALQTYQEALARAGKGDTPDPGLRLRVIGRLGLAFYRFGDFTAGARYHEEALDLLKAVRSTQDLVGRYLETAQAQYEAGDVGRALTEAGKGRALLDLRADFVMAAALHVNAGLIAEDRGDWEEAAQRFRAALSLYRRAGDRLGEVAALIELARFHHHAGLTQKALAACDEALELAGLIGDVPLQAQGRQVLGKVYAEMKDRERAIESLTESVRLFEQADRPSELADSCYELGELFMTMGERDKALAYFQRATALFRQLGLASGRGNMDDQMVKRMSRPPA